MIIKQVFVYLFVCFIKICSVAFSFARCVLLYVKRVCTGRDSVGAFQDSMYW